MEISTQRLINTLIGNIPNIQLEHFDLHDHEIAVVLQASADQQVCPDCALPTSRIHSRYTRSLVDLPWAGWVVRIL